MDGRTGRAAATRVELSGKRFGCLLVTDYAGYSIVGGHALWSCTCDCGRTRMLQGRVLLHQNKRDCGCGLSKKLEKASKAASDSDGGESNVR